RDELLLETHVVGLAELGAGGVEVRLRLVGPLGPAAGLGGQQANVAAARPELCGGDGMMVGRFVAGMGQIGLGRVEMIPGLAVAPVVPDHHNAADEQQRGDDQHPRLAAVHGEPWPGGGAAVNSFTKGTSSISAVFSRSSGAAGSGTAGPSSVPIKL